MGFFKITLTTSGGFTTKQVDEFEKVFDRLNHVYVVVEYGESGGNRHLEGIIERDTIKTYNVTTWIKRQYALLDIDVSYNSIRVKAATDRIGAIIYASKELKKLHTESEVISLRGWTQTWIDKQIKDNVSKISFKELKKRGTKMTKGTGGALMYEWCIANNRQVLNKGDYIEVVKTMGDQGFMFGCVRHVGIYQDVCCLFGDGTAASDVAMNELHFLP